MGSYKWGYKSPNLGYITIVTLLITPLITTHEPPSVRPVKESTTPPTCGEMKSITYHLLSNRRTYSSNHLRREGKFRGRHLAPVVSTVDDINPALP